MLTAREATAIACLITHDDYAIHKRIEVRIWDSIQNGGTNIIYAGEITDNVVKALRALGYVVVPMSYQDKVKMYKISWGDFENERYATDT